MLQLNIRCRHDGLDEFFQKNCLTMSDANLHFPFLIFVRKDYELEVKVANDPMVLLNYPDDTQIMKQWPGAKRSDYFTFTIGQLKEYRKRVLGKLPAGDPDWEF